MARDSKAGRLDGVVIGVLIDIAGDGRPLVLFMGNRSEIGVPAATTTALGPADVGCEVALLFEEGDPERPVVIGRLLRPAEPAEAPSAPPAQTFEVLRDGERLELTAEREIVLRCGKASITLTRAGKVLIRGAYVSSRSTGANRIKGGSVHLN